MRKYRVRTATGPANWPPVYDVHLDNGTVWTAMSTSDLHNFETTAHALGWRYDGPWVGSWPIRRNVAS